MIYPNSKDCRFVVNDISELSVKNKTRKSCVAEGRIMNKKPYDRISTQTHVP